MENEVVKSILKASCVDCKTEDMTDKVVAFSVEKYLEVVCFKCQKLRSPIQGDAMGAGGQVISPRREFSDSQLLSRIELHLYEIKTFLQAGKKDKVEDKK